MNKKEILNYDFVINDYDKFTKWLDRGYKDGVFSKEECILREDYD